MDDQVNGQDKLLLQNNGKIYQGNFSFNFSVPSIIDNASYLGVDIINKIHSQVSKSYSIFS